MDSTEFLDYLRKEFEQYRQIPSHECERLREKKAFLNGLMTSAKIFGVSFDELQSVVDSAEANAVKAVTLSENESILDVPTFIRPDIKVTL